MTQGIPGGNSTTFNAPVGTLFAISRASQSQSCLYMVDQSANLALIAGNTSALTVTYSVGQVTVANGAGGYCALTVINV